jgi:hypothetical protein
VCSRDGIVQARGGPIVFTTLLAVRSIFWISDDDVPLVCHLLRRGELTVSVDLATKTQLGLEESDTIHKQMTPLKWDHERNASAAAVDP